MRAKVSAIVLVASLLGTTAAISGAAAHDAKTPPSSVDPADFVRHVTNPFFPLRPGNVLVYRGVKDARTQTDRVTVTHRTKWILGVRTTVVRDVATHEGRLLEKTVDWFAQDKVGNVWYFGEATKSFESDGSISTEGSWTAGVNGARPGIVMEADPRVADGYRQEQYTGHADDRAWVLTRGGSIRVPYGLVHHVLLTMEWTPLEPSVVDKKVYARGIGIVREASAAGPHETLELVRFGRA